MMGEWAMNANGIGMCRAHVSIVKPNVHKLHWNTGPRAAQPKGTKADLSSTSAKGGTCSH